jgi:hypothetical protein
MSKLAELGSLQAERFEIASDRLLTTDLLAMYGKFL